MGNRKFSTRTVGANVAETGPQIIDGPITVKNRALENVERTSQTAYSSRENHHNQMDKFTSLFSEPICHGFGATLATIWSHPTVSVQTEWWLTGPSSKGLFRTGLFFHRPSLNHGTTTTTFIIRCFLSTAQVILGPHKQIPQKLSHFLSILLSICVHNRFSWLWWYRKRACFPFAIFSVIFLTD